MKLADLRRFAVAQTLIPPTTLERALRDLSYVQADPIRAPARAQDLILRQRVDGYRAGDLERRYGRGIELPIEEDFFLNYGFVTRELHALLHPRPRAAASALQRKRARLLLDFVRARGTVHPRQVDEHFAHGTVRNYWGGSSNATTHLLDGMHYRGLLRVARREKGIRLYRLRDPHVERERVLPRAERDARLDRLVDIVVRLYAPVTAASLSTFVRRLRVAVPQWAEDIPRALARAKESLTKQHVGGVDWYWRAVDEARATGTESDDRVRLLAPFDPVVQDRRRFELLWQWEYRFEAYTPAPRRKFGYYALPLLFRDQVIGWANASLRESGELACETSFVSGRAPRDRVFTRELAAEIERLRLFLRPEG